MAGEAAARGRPDSPEPRALERQNLLALLQERRRREAEVREVREVREARERRCERAGPSSALPSPQGRFPLHRLLVLARPGPGAAAAVAGYYRELFENGLEDHPREPVSGLLLVCPSYMCHVIESCTSTIHLIIQDLASIQNQGHSALLQEIKVLVVTHDIPTRLFPDWYVATATSPVPRPQGWTESQPTEEVVAECLTFLLKLADYIQRSEDDSEDTSGSAHTVGPELLIPAQTINCLCNAEACASPDDFLRTYLSPSQPVLDSEIVWPAPSYFSP